MGFDLAAARQAGYSDEEIASHLAKPAGFDVASAKQAGYSDNDIIQSISGKWEPTNTELDVVGKTVGVQPLPSATGPANQIQPLEPDPLRQALTEQLAEAAQKGGMDSDEYRQLSAAHAEISQADADTADILTRIKDYAGAVGQGVVGQGAGSTLTGLGELYDVGVRTTERALGTVLPGGAMEALRAPIVPAALTPGQILKRPGEQLKAAGEAMAPPKDRQNLGTDIAAGVGQLGFQIASYLATGGASSTAMLFSQGADIMAEKTRQDVAPQAAKDAAILGGGAITALTERYGLDLILNRVPPAIKNAALRQIADVMVAGGIEAAQEVAEGLLHDISRRILTNPDAPVLEGIDREALAAGGSGAIARAVINAATGMRMRSRTSQPQAQPEPAATPTEPVVAPAVETIPAADVTPTAPAQQAPAAEAVGAPRRIWTAKGESIDTRMEAVEADQLVTSHDVTGNVNPAFPAELQPRDRSRQASRAQIANIAQNLKPELLGDTGTASDGAPVVGQDGVIESGNARTLGLQQAYRTGKGEAYKQWLTDNAAAFGLDAGQISGLKNPVLVRRRTGQMTTEQRAAFARDANQATVAAMAPAEVAKADAERITSQDMAHFAPDESGNVLAASNEVFLRQFAKRLGQNEVAGMMTADGRPTKQMADRIQQAVFSKAYQDDRLVALQAEEANPEIRNILAGLTQAAPAFARARSIDAELGNLNVVPHLVEAANLIRKARTEGRGVSDLLSQQGLFDSVPRETSALARFMDDNKRSGKRMGEAFKTLGETIENTLRGRENGQLFGDDQITMAQVIEAASGRMVKEYGAEQAQGDLLAQPKAEPAPVVQNAGVPEGITMAAPVKAGDGVSYKILKDGKFIGHISGFEHGKSFFMLNKTELNEALRGRGIYQWALQEVANKYHEGLRVDAFEISHANRKAMAKIKTLEWEGKVTGDLTKGRLWVRPVAQPKAIEEPKIPKADNLNPDERAIESRFSDYLTNNTDAAIAKYQEKFGNVINTDNARELSEDYSATKEARSTLSPAVHEPASWLAKEIYRRELAKPPGEGKHPVVLFTAGGAGAGKSSAVNQALGEAAESAQIVYDTNMNGFKSAKVKIDQALAAGKDVVITYVHRHPVESLVRGALPRAMRMGRTVPMEAHVETHQGAAATIFEVAKHYQDNPRVHIIAIDNTRGKGQARAAELDIVKEIDYNQDLRARLDAALEEEYKHGRISETVYRGTKGAQKAPDEGVRSQDRGRTRPEPESKRDAGERRPADVAPEEAGREVADTDILGYGTLAANPFGIALQKTVSVYRKAAQGLVDRFHDKIGYRYEALRDLPDKQRFLTRYYELLGKVSEIEGVQSKLYAAFKNASDTDKVAVYQYLTTANANPGAIQDADVQRSAVAAKRLIDRIGERLVHENLLSRQTVDEHRGEYLPRIYLKHLLGESSMKALGRGMVPSDMGYLKERQDIPEDVRRLILGEIKDPGYLSSRGFGIPARDVAILDFFRDIAGNKKWIYPNVVTEWGGKPVSVFWLKAEAERLQKQTPYLPAADRPQVDAIVRKMRGIYEPVIDEIGKTPDNYKQIPDTAKYGAMRGLWVRAEIHELLLGSRNLVADNDVMQKIINAATWYNQIWKSAKVAWNPPAQVRNHVSNGILVHLSGVPFAMVPVRYVQAIQAIRSNNKYWRIAKRYGVKAASFNSQELLRIERDLLDLMSREQGKFSIATIKNMGGIVNNAVGDAYQFSESLWKTAKIIDAMKREGLSPAEAAKSAHDAVFDYSMVPQFVKKLRTMPIGAPFATFNYKVLPLLLKTAIVHPERYVPYIAIPYILAEMIKETFDVDDDDLKALQKALPKWLEEKGTAYFLPIKDAHGRWQAMDFGYFFPWGGFQTLSNAVTSTSTEGALGRTANVLQAVGAFGGPVTNMITAVQSGTDPFTGKEITNKNDPPAKQAADLMQYLWRLNAPTWITDIGVAGHMYRAVTGKVNPRLGPQFGEQMSTPGQAALRGVGVNIYPIDPEKTRDENLRNMAFDIKNVVRRMRTQLRDPNLTEEQKANMEAEYKALIEQRRQEFEKYEKASKVHPNLRAINNGSQQPAKER